MNDELTGFFLIVLVGICFCVISFGIGHNTGIDHEQKKAIRAGVASKEENKYTQEVEFKYHTPDDIIRLYTEELTKELIKGMPLLNPNLKPKPETKKDREI